MRECAKAIVRPTGAHDLTAGETIRRPIDSDVQVRSPTIEIPEATEPAPMAIDVGGASAGKSVSTSAASPPAGADVAKSTAAAATNANGTIKVLTFHDTRRPGLYRLNWQSDAGPASDLYAVNPDARESDLTPITADDLRGLWGNLQPEIFANLQTDSDLSTRGQEIWRPLAMCLMALMAIEACFATWTGRQR